MERAIPQRKLGKTGEMVSIIGLGGFHLSVIPGHSEAINLIREAIEKGINFMDNSWDYSGGKSEHRMGEALRGGWRQRVFLMSKVDGRNKKAARNQLDESLQRLQTDYLDLLQLHEIIRMTDPDRAFAPGGAMEAFDEARDAGKIRYIGFTGHKNPDIHLKMLEQDFDWDTVQMPLNVLDAHYNSFEKKVLHVLLERDIGVLGMKPLSAGNLLATGTVSAIEVLHYAMNLPTDTVITGIQSRRDLNQAIEAAGSFTGLSEEEVNDILSRTAQIAQTGEYEAYKTTISHDSTTIHPEWLEAS